MRSGVYAIRCLPTGRSYIGSAKDIGARWRTHRSHLRRGVHHAKFLQRSWDKYGEPSFEFVILRKVTEPSELIPAEQEEMDRERALGVLMNGRPIAASNLGMKHSDATKKRISEHNKSRPPVSKETGRKISAALKGKKKSPEHARKVGLAQRGKKLSDAHVEKLRKSAQISGLARKGKKLPAEWVQKIKEGKKLHPIPPDVYAKIGRSVAMAHMKISKADAQLACDLYKNGETQRKIAKQLKISPSAISRIVAGHRKHYEVSHAI